MRNIALSITICFIIGIVFLAGCTQQQTPPSTTNTVTIKNFAFDPATLTVSVGTNVTWINEDSVNHIVKSDTDVFESASLSSGQSFTHTFTTIGTYNYTCSIHPSMHGKIIVE